MSNLIEQTVKLANEAALEAYKTGYSQGYMDGIKAAQAVVNQIFEKHEVKPDETHS